MWKPWCVLCWVYCRFQQCLTLPDGLRVITESLPVSLLEVCESHRITGGGELFGLFNYPGRRSSQLKYYTVKIPLRLESGPDGICALDGNWLDHMTQHFNSGASLVDGYFQISNHSVVQEDVLYKEAFLYPVWPSETVSMVRNSARLEFNVMGVASHQ
ncbi:hypothetical protein DNTS_025945 [Danionella cerebrum]|uniref:Uncharacterized protein n=1 Tax=Danionella cerebrum TaxID=2873325 RepID=A0A553NKU1_9TELE|nr:hypothetical protein DNTS_025945 [Danionella translucida]